MNKEIEKRIIKLSNQCHAMNVKAVEFAIWRIIIDYTKSLTEELEENKLK